MSDLLLIPSPCFKFLLSSIHSFDTIYLKGRDTDLKKYFQDTSNFLSFALALIPAILLYIFQPTEKVPYFVFAISVLINLLLAWLSVKLLLDSKKVSYPSIELFRCCNGKCLCKPNPYLSARTAISFYKNDNGFEEFLCHGYVETITQSGLVQIVLMGDDDGTHFTFISANMNDIIIKPEISIDTQKI